MLNVVDAGPPKLCPDQSASELRIGQVVNVGGVSISACEDRAAVNRGREESIRVGLIRENARPGTVECWDFHVDCFLRSPREKMNREVIGFLRQRDFETRSHQPTKRAGRIFCELDPNNLITTDDHLCYR